MELLDGRKASHSLIDNLKKDLEKIDRCLGLCVIQIGNDYASNIYVRSKQKMANYLNINFKHIKLDKNVSEEYVLNLIDELNNNDIIDGIMVELPLPKHLNSKRILNAIKSSKDIDGLTDYNMGKLAHNEGCLIPCTAIGVFDLLNFYNLDVKNKHVVIIGRSNLVGKPLAFLLLNNNATVTICHSETKNLKDITKMADILVVASGITKMINKDYIKENSIIIDAGINKDSEGLSGDVDFDDVTSKVSFITPVPFGVGQMTVAEVYVNLYKAYMSSRK